uniref:G_PROTEIN_RECEP_F1_2 domain-containing protein n=1 Tax=Caenorhabditis tropicalis TaxID=1561998 RepID=A0A1I7TCS1_9PELO
MARAVNISPFASYTVVPITSAWPPDDPQADRVQFAGMTTAKALLAIAILAMIIMTTVGNALVCLAVLLVRKLKHPQNFLLVSLAVADFFVGLVVMPLALIDLLFDKWPLGR